MTLDELKKEAREQGYYLQKMPKSDCDCSCIVPYPNEMLKKKNGKWKCVDCYENIQNVYCIGSKVFKTKCRKKGQNNDA